MISGLHQWRGKEVKGSDTDHNAAVVPSWKAGTNQTRHKVCRGRAVVPADAGGECSHSSVVEVQRAVVCGVGIQTTESHLPYLRKCWNKHRITNSLWPTITYPAHILPLESETLIQQPSLFRIKKKKKKRQMAASITVIELEHTGQVNNIIHHDQGVSWWALYITFFQTRSSKNRISLTVNLQWLLLMAINRC